MRLACATLGHVPVDVAAPRYAPADVGIGVVHLGIGAFHRAHQAVFFDDLIAQGGGDWRICGVSLRSAGVRAQLADQDCLYTLVERDAEGERLRIIGSVAEILVAGEQRDAVIARLAAPATQLVTLTITEKGYCHDPATGAINVDHPDILHDLANPAAPRSAIGLLVAALAQRRASGGGPLTILSCDNLPHNGALLRGVVLALAGARDAALAAWIEASIAFPASMVDRIVPATTDADIGALTRQIGMVDRGMVKSEPFRQWVIEDWFAGARPALDTVGAQFVADVRPFEHAKLRMLNGAHSTVAYLGLCHGYETVDAAMADRRIAAVVDQLMREAASTLPPIAGLDPQAYATVLQARFRNPALQHRLAQIAMDGSQKIPQRLLGTMADVYAAGGTPRAAATGVAAWLRHLSSAHLNDPLADRLRAAVSDDVAMLVARALSIEKIFGPLGRQQWCRDLIVEMMP